MRIRKNGKVIRLTESDLMRITKKVLREQDEKEYKYPSKMKIEVAEVMAQIGVIRNLKPGGGYQDVIFDTALSQTQSQPTIENAMSLFFNCDKQDKKEICKYRNVNKSGTPWSNLLREVQDAMDKIYKDLGNKKKSVKGKLNVGGRISY
jgi:ribosomal protein S8